MIQFVGRQTELQRLREAIQKTTASFIVVKGRRRIGKTRLIEEFSKNFEHYYCFAGLPPEKGTSKQSQLDEFGRQIARNFKSPPARYEDWTNALWAIAEQVKSGKTLLLFDEISWMGSCDPNFLGKIKNFWDLQLKKNNKLIFIVCGSASSWIEKNILSSTGFVGRISFTLTLRELLLSECNKFWPHSISAYEKFKLLAVTGGVPKYLEEINPKRSAEENIKKLCFTEGGLLVEEFEKIFSDTFLRHSAFYKDILTVLSTGAKEQSKIQKSLERDTPGRLSEYLSELELAGFITKDHTWDIKTGQDSKIRQYRLQDNYLRFYLKYIEKNLSKINRGSFTLKSLSSLPEWHSVMGFQFENLVLSNRKLIHKCLGVKPEEIICENPYFQKKTTKTSGCQIDYLIQTKFDTLYVCEIKFSRNEIGISIIQEVQDKIKKLKYFKRYSCRPVLIHVNGVTEEVIDHDFFANIIDLGEMFDEGN